MGKDQVFVLSFADFFSTDGHLVGIRRHLGEGGIPLVSSFAYCVFSIWGWESL